MEEREDDERVSGGEADIKEEPALLLLSSELLFGGRGVSRDRKLSVMKELLQTKILLIQKHEQNRITEREHFTKL